MGSGPHLYPGYREWLRGGGSGNLRDYTNWLSANGYANGNAFLTALNANQGAISGGQLTNPLTGQPYPTPTGTPPAPGAPPTAAPTPVAPPPSIPSPQGQPAFAPPQVQMPQMLANPQPQGLGGMPLIRDRMMGTTMSPFAGPNWGVPQVNPAYLTQTVRLPQGATPADVMSTGGATQVGIAPPTQIPSAQAPVGLGGAKFPRQPIYGLGTV
jgi:hypothetical protein